MQDKFKFLFPLIHATHAINAYCSYNIPSKYKASLAFLIEAIYIKIRFKERDNGITANYVQIV